MGAVTLSIIDVRKFQGGGFAGIRYHIHRGIRFTTSSLGVLIFKQINH
jgi:hypothetical protein